jgi:hypothetical protein
MKEKEKYFLYRVIVDHEPVAFRDILISSHATLFDLHQAIIKAFDFNSDELSMFYQSNEEWERKEEFLLMKMEDSQEQKEMSEVFLYEVTSRPSDRLLYIYDLLRVWVFYVELIHILDELENPQEIKIPAILKSYGPNPDQYSKTPEDVIFNVEGFDNPEIEDISGYDDDLDRYEDSDLNWN